MAAAVAVSLASPSCSRVLVKIVVVTWSNIKSRSQWFKLIQVTWPRHRHRRPAALIVQFHVLQSHQHGKFLNIYENRNILYANTILNLHFFAYKYEILTISLSGNQTISLSKSFLAVWPRKKCPGCPESLEEGQPEGRTSTANILRVMYCNAEHMWLGTTWKLPSWGYHVRVRFSPLPQFGPPSYGLSTCISPTNLPISGANILL